MEKIPISKATRIREEFIAGTLHRTNLAAELGLHRRTVGKHAEKLKQIKTLYPERLSDFNFELPKKVRPKTKLYQDLMAILPVLIDRADTPCLFAESLWADYRKVYPHGYGIYWFEHHYRAWSQAHKLCRFYNRRVRVISNEDDTILQKWRNSGTREQWKKATVILGSFHKRPLTELMQQVEKARETILLWIDNYKSGGIPQLDLQPYTTCPALLEGVRVKQENLTKLLHQTPKIHGFNRASWRVEDLVTAYITTYGVTISRSCVLENLHKMGLGYYKSRELFTSHDPDFREKLEHIKNILRNLGDNERFFSVDEYGPFAIKLKLDAHLHPLGKPYRRSRKAKAASSLSLRLNSAATKSAIFTATKRTPIK